MARIAHVITGLGGGGAESALLRLVQALPQFEHSVISLTGGGTLLDEFKRAGVEPIELGLRPNLGVIPGFFRLGKRLRTIAPDVIQTWMCHADFLGGLAARAYTRSPVAWGVHQVGNTQDTPSSSRWVQRACALLSSTVPKRIVICSSAGRNYCVSAGYAEEKCEVIYNGIDTHYFQFSQTTRAATRRNLGLRDTDIAVLMPARWHPDKDLLNFIAAASIAIQANTRLKFLLAGENMNKENETLSRAIANSGHGEAFQLLDFQRDMCALYAAADMGVLSSRTEALPTVVMEGMSCELPFIATQVGDSEAIIGDCGRTVPVKNPQALANAMLETLNEIAAGATRNPAARARICANYSLESSAAQYGDMYQQLQNESAGKSTQRLN